MSIRKDDKFIELFEEFMISCIIYEGDKSLVLKRIEVKANNLIDYIDEYSASMGVYGGKK